MSNARKRQDDEVYIPTPEEAAEIEAGLDELDRGESVTLEEFMSKLRAIHEEERARR